MDLLLATDQHEDATNTRGSTEGYASEDVHGADEEGNEEVKAVVAEASGAESDEGEVGVSSDVCMEVVPTKVASVEDDEGEEQAVEQAEIACVDSVSVHDDRKGSEQDTIGGETQHAGSEEKAECEEASEGEAVAEGEDKAGSEQHEDEGEHEEESVGGKETAMPQDGTEAETSGVIANDQFQLTTQVGAEEGASAVATAQGMDDNNAKVTRNLRAVNSHPEAPVKKSHKSEAPVASPVRSPLGALAQHLALGAVPGTDRDPSVDRRSRSPRARPDPASTEKQQKRKAQAATLTSAIEGEMKPQRGRSAGSAKLRAPASQVLDQGNVSTRTQSVPARQTLSEQHESMVNSHAAKCERMLEEQLNTKKKIMNEFVSKNDFARAAVAQEEVNQLQALAEELRAKNTRIAELASKEKFSEAAAVVEEIKAMEVHLTHRACEGFTASAESCKPVELCEQKMQLEEQLSATQIMVGELAARSDCVGAAAEQKEVKKITKDTMMDEHAVLSEQQSEVQKKLQGVPVAKNDSAGDVAVLLDEQLNAKLKTMVEFATKGDLTGAAAIKKDAKEIVAIQAELRAKITLMEELTASGDVKGAAAALESKKKTE